MGHFLLVRPILHTDPYHDALTNLVHPVFSYPLLSYKDHFLESYLISLYHIEQVISADQGSVMIFWPLLHIEHKGILTMSRSNSFHLWPTFRTGSSIVLCSTIYAIIVQFNSMNYYYYFDFLYHQTLKIQIDQFFQIGVFLHNSSQTELFP